MRSRIGILLVGLVAAGCSLQEQVTAAPLGEALLTPAPTPTAEECPTALMWGALAPDPEGGALVVNPDVGAHPVRWPIGYVVEEEPALRLLDEVGTVIASEGEMVYLGGGMDAADEVFIACRPVDTEPP